MDGDPVSLTLVIQSIDYSSIPTGQYFLAYVVGITLEFRIVIIKLVSVLGICIGNELVINSISTKAGLCDSTFSF